jgi:predicted phosphodiesterase
MKKLIISDTHLSKFNKKQFSFLYDLIESVDEVIINGDFWDSWCISFEKFVNSKWQELFDLLLAKNTIYVYGNHDPKHLCDERCYLFAVETCDSYQFELFGQKFYCEHGHRQMRGFDMGKFINFYLKMIGRQPKVLCYLIAKVEHWLFHLFPKLGTNSKIGKRSNRIIKENSKEGQINIYGHSHHAEIDWNKEFINTGAIMCKQASYVLISEDGVQLKKSRY